MDQNVENFFKYQKYLKVIFRLSWLRIILFPTSDIILICDKFQLSNPYRFRKITVDRRTDEQTDGLTGAKWRLYSCTPATKNALLLTHMHLLRNISASLGDPLINSLIGVSNNLSLTDCVTEREEYNVNKLRCELKQCLASRIYNALLRMNLSFLERNDCTYICTNKWISIPKQVRIIGYLCLHRYEWNNICTYAGTNKRIFVPTYLHIVGYLYLRS